MASPQSEAVGIDGTQFMANSRDMVNQPQILHRVVLGSRRWEDIQAGERKDAGLLPMFDGGLDLWGPHEIRLVGSCGPVIGHGNIIIRTADLVLGAVPARNDISYAPKVESWSWRNLPLREVFVTSDVTALAVLASLAGLGVTAAWGTTTRASHCESCKLKVETRELDPVVSVMKQHRKKRNHTVG